MKKMSNKLDERQEQALLRIEHVGCWLAFGGLFLALIVQMAIYRFDWKALAGEWIVFLILSVYLTIACIKAGIWDRRLQPNGKTNLIVSLVAALVFGGAVFAAAWIKYPEKAAASATAGVITAVFAFVGCFSILSLMAFLYKRRRKALEAEPEA